jgi:hypothetical protein
MQTLKGKSKVPKLEMNTFNYRIVVKPCISIFAKEHSLVI